MRIWIDNDGCPARMREIVFKAATRLAVPVTVVGNSYMHTPPGGLIKMVVVDSGFDAADKHIAAHVEPGDLVITSDVPLASEIVGRGATGISARGEEYTASNVQERLAIRNLTAEIRSTGTLHGGPPPMSEKDVKSFAAGFDRVLTRLHRAAAAKR